MRGFHAALMLSAVAAAPVVGAASAPAAPAATAQSAAVPSGINWFTDLRAGLAEAERTGRPVLLLAAAPSCGGVPGTW